MWLHPVYNYQHLVCIRCKPCFSPVILTGWQYTVWQELSSIVSKITQDCLLTFPISTKPCTCWDVWFLLCLSLPTLLCNTYCYVVGQYNQPAVWFSLVLTYFNFLRAYITWTETDLTYQLLTTIYNKLTLMTTKSGVNTESYGHWLPTRTHFSYKIVNSKS